MKYTGLSLSHKATTDLADIGGGGAPRWPIGFALLLAFTVFPPLAPPAEAQLELEEVLVTARRREENLQETPIAVSAFSGESLSELGITDMSDLRKVAANFDLQDGNGTTGAASIFIRGVGARNTGVNFDSGVGIYIDGVYASRADGAMLDNVDIQSIQVLRGPQGTLFGKNTTGGAVLYTTNKPTDEFGMHLQGRAGDYSRLDGQLTLNVPLGDSLLSRFSIYSVNRDGYVESRSNGRMGLTNDEEYNDVARQGGQAQFRWNASEDMTVDINYIYANVDQAARGQNCKVVDSIEGSGWQSQLQNPLIMANTTQTIQEWCKENQDLGEYKIQSNLLPNKYEAETHTAALTLGWRLSDTLDFTSITSYRSTEGGSVDELDAIGIAVLHRSNFDEHFGELRETEAWSQEFKFTGSALDGKLDYTVGVYGYTEETDAGTEVSRQAPQFAPVHDVAGIPGTGLLSQIRMGVQAGIPGFTSLAALRTQLTGFETQRTTTQMTLDGLNVQVEGLPEGTPVPEQLAKGIAAAEAGIMMLDKGIMGLQRGVTALTTLDTLEGQLPATAEAYSYQFNTGEFLAENNSASIFGQVDWHLSEALSLTLGLRYTWEERELDRIFRIADIGTISTVAQAAAIPSNQLVPLPILPSGRATFNHAHGVAKNMVNGQPDPNADQNMRVSSSEVTPMASLQYRFEDTGAIDSGIFYITAANGFQSGGITDTVSVFTGKVEEYDPEKVWNYEMGLKLDAFNRRLRMNVALFHTDYEDRQLTTIRINPATGQIQGALINAESSTISGIEVETTFIPVENLQITANFTFNDGEIDKYDDERISLPPTSGVPAGCTAITIGADTVMNCPVDRSDENLPRLPESVYFLSAQYQWKTAIGTIIPMVSWSLRADVDNCFDRSSCLSELYLVDQEELSARLTWLSQDESLRVTAYGTNLTDETYIIGGTPLIDVTQTAGIQYNIPRMYGVEFSYKF